MNENKWINKIHQGDVSTILKQMPSNFVDTVITSPPYWGLRDYGTEGQIGLEKHPQEYINKLVEVSREIKRVLKKTGSFYLNLGDTYCSSVRETGRHDTNDKTSTNFGGWANWDGGITRIGKIERSNWLQPKQLMLVPSRVAIALQDNGWILRNDIIWCLSGTTKVYAKTQKQEAPAMIKDIVRLKPETVSLWDGKKWNQVKNFYLNKTSINKIQFTLRNGEIISCTGEHRWLTKNGLKKASDLLVGDSLEKTILPEPEHPVSPSCLSDDIGWFVGVYLAEGSFGKDSNVIQISSHIKNINRYNKLSKVAESYHGTCKMHHTGGKSATINLYGNVLVSIIKHYIHGKDAKTKGITPRCWTRSNNFLKSLLFGYLECDGYYDKENNRYRLGFTRNYRLADDLRTICARLGYNFKIQKSISKISDKSYKSFRGEIRIRPSNRYNTKSDGEIINIQKAKAKNFYDIELVDEPHIFALASGILTHNSKPNPMPSSVKDRLNNTYEHVFHFVKSRRYYYDLDAIRVLHMASESKPSSIIENSLDRYDSKQDNAHKLKSSRNKHLKNISGMRQAPEPNEPHAFHKYGKNPGDVVANSSLSVDKHLDSTIKHDIAVDRIGNFSYNDPLHTKPYHDGGKNHGDFWDICTQPFSEAHFAVFPSELVESPIKASCPEWICKKCGKPRERLIEKAGRIQQHWAPGTDIKTEQAKGKHGETSTLVTGYKFNYKTTGWSDCGCNAGFKPGIILDPFAGSGTACLVAKQLGRRYIGIELNPEYVKKARKRLNESVAVYDLLDDTISNERMDHKWKI